MPIAVIHEARFVHFDDGELLLFATSFDGSWDSYLVDFASKTLKLFAAISSPSRGSAACPTWTR